MNERDRDRANNILDELFAILNNHVNNDGQNQKVKRQLSLYKSTVRMLSFRKARASILGNIFSSEPCWELLLTLYAARFQGVRISVTDLTHETSIPTATVIRWLTALEKADFINRDADPHDGRRSWISLKKQAVERVERCLSLDAFVPADQEFLNSKSTQSHVIVR